MISPYQSNPVLLIPLIFFACFSMGLPSRRQTQAMGGSQWQNPPILAKRVTQRLNPLPQTGSFPVRAIELGCLIAKCYNAMPISSLDNSDG